MRQVNPSASEATLIGLNAWSDSGGKPSRIA